MMSEPPYGWEGDELERAAKKIIDRLPETQLEVECEELRQAVEASRVKNEQLKNRCAFLDVCFAEACEDLYEARRVARLFYSMQKRWSETERKFVQKTEWLKEAPWLERKDGPDEPRE